MTGTDRLSLACLVAALCAGVTLVPLTEDRSYLALALVMMLLSAGIGALLRRLRLGEVAVRVAQLAPALLIPGLFPEAWDPARLYGDTYSFIQTAFAPMPFHTGFAVFCAGLVWVVYLLCETLAIGLHSPAWTFPVLVLPYLIPSLAIYVESSPFLFCFTAAGYALVLATATSTTVAPDGADEVTASGWRRGVATTAVASTAIALSGMVLFSLPIPERSGNGATSGGSGSVQLGDPSVDLIRNLNSNSTKVLITYRSSDGAGQYLRLAALPSFDRAGFHLAATDLVPLQFAAGRPAVAESGTVRTSIDIEDLSSEYLPVPWFPLSAEVGGDNWRYDPKTLAVVAVGAGRTSATRDLSYTTTSARLPAESSLLPTLRAAGDPGDGGLTLQLPDDLSVGVRDLAEDLTLSRRTDGEKALALYDFLRSDAFTYSTAVSPGTTLGTLDDFLLGSRTGYCEQFAGSMAVMARVVGIPSRVVVGFLPGRKVGDQWEVTGRNMHAWAELYFQDAGWVPVDATPVGAANGPQSSASASPSHTASASPTSAATTATPSIAPVTPAAGGDGGTGNPLAWLAGTAVLFGLVAAGPRLVRDGLRRFRIAGSPDGGRAIERAWAEVRAVVRDRGRDWPAGTTRQVAARLGPELDTGGRRALGDLALAVERTRYAAAPERTPGLADRVALITAAMERSWATPRSGTWWPRSLRPEGFSFRRPRIRLPRGQRPSS